MQEKFDLKKYKISEIVKFLNEKKEKLLSLNKKEKLLSLNKNEKLKSFIERINFNKLFDVQEEINVFYIYNCLFEKDYLSPRVGYSGYYGDNDDEIYNLIKTLYKDRRYFFTDLGKFFNKYLDDYSEKKGFFDFIEAFEEIFEENPNEFYDVYKNYYYDFNDNPKDKDSIEKIKGKVEYIKKVYSKEYYSEKLSKFFNEYLTDFSEEEKLDLKKYLDVLFEEKQYVFYHLYKDCSCYFNYCPKDKDSIEKFKKSVEDIKRVYLKEYYFEKLNEFFKKYLTCFLQEESLDFKKGFYVLFEEDANEFYNIYKKYFNDPILKKYYNDDYDPMNISDLQEDSIKKMRGIIEHFKSVYLNR